MPRTELEYLRKEVEKIKRNPLGDTQASITLLDSMSKLNVSVSRLNEIFEGANDEMVKAFNEAAVQEQLRKMMEQQEKLARGIVAVAEMVKDLERKMNTPLPSLDQIAPPKAPAQPSVQINESAIKAELSASQDVSMQARNPFALDGNSAPVYQPILSNPLPRPGGNAPPPQSGTAEQAQQTGPIPDSDIPPPPPRRF